MTTIAVELDPVDYARLREEAARQGKAPEALARDYLRAQLPDQIGTDERRRRGLEALDALAKLREELRQAGYPPVDAAELVRQGREELECRPES
ncbi:MAG: hypothetical protein ACRDIY_18575 [Chloroflexota bacterium]